jgi:outer membrane translocation and assembly module TamA
VVDISASQDHHESAIAPEALLDPTLRDELLALGLDPTTGVQDGRLSRVMAELDAQNLDEPLDPRRGWGVNLHTEQAGGWLAGTYDYVRLVGQGRGYLTPIGPLTLAGRLRYGTVAAFGAATDVPFSHRFFLGGATSLRGWGRFQVSPLSGSGLPIGGRSLFEASAEIRTRLFGGLGLVGFVDAGNVWRQTWGFDASDLLFDAGPGFRYDTPVGPVRFDIAYQLTPLEGLRIDGEPEDRRWRIHFSIGQAF